MHYPRGFEECFWKFLKPYKGYGLKYSQLIVIGHIPSRFAIESTWHRLIVFAVMDEIANRPRGFAILSYTTEDESKKAVEGIHGKVSYHTTYLGINETSVLNM